MPERELGILIRAKDLASRTIKGVKSEVSSLSKVGQQALGGLSTAIKNIGIVSAVGLTGAIGLGVRSLADLERSMKQTEAVIESTGGAAGVSAKEVADYANELENLTTVDNKVIQDGENMLLTFTNIGKDVFPDATKAALNLSVAMAKGDASQVDMQAAAIQLGKALNDPIKGVTALRKVGVTFTKQQQDQIKVLVEAGDVMGAQRVILQELEKEFGKAGEAAGEGAAADWRRLKDAGEDVTMALARGLMPALTRVTNWLSTKLADPKVIAAIDDIGQGLGDAAMKALDFIESFDFAAIGQGLALAKDAASTIVGAFMSLPPWVQTAVITGWGLNKLSGGALTGVIGELGKGLVKGVLGMNAGVVNINAATVNGGAPGTAAAGGAGKAGLLATGAAAVTGAGVIIGAEEIASGVQRGFAEALGGSPLDVEIAGKLPVGLNIGGPIDRLVRAFQGDFRSDLEIIQELERQGITAIDGGATKVNQHLGPKLQQQQQTAAQTLASNERNEALARQKADQVKAQIAAGDTRTELAIARNASAITSRAITDSASERAAIRSAGAEAKGGGLAAAAAIRAKDLSVRVFNNVTTNVSVRDMVYKTSTTNKYGAIKS